MVIEEAIKELQEEWDVFLEETSLKYKTENGFQKELEDNSDLKKVVEANYMAIKSLEFVKWVANEIFDEEWEFNKDSFEEVACRKLEKLGIVRKTDNGWVLVESEE